METKELIAIEKKTGLIVLQGGDDQKIRDFYVTGESVDSILEQIEKEVSGHVPDVSTAKGRNAITANVTVAGNYKTFFENTGKDLSAEYKAIPSKIDKTRKMIKEYLAELKIKARKPLTDWEDEQKLIAAKKLAEEEAKELQAQVDADHELAIEQYKNHLRDVADKKQADELAAKQLAKRQEEEQIARDEILKDEAAAAAKLKAENDAKEEIRLAVKLKQDAIERENQTKINAAVENKNAINLAERLKQEAIDRQKQAEIYAEAEITARKNAEWLVYISEAYAINNDLIAKAQAEKVRLNNEWLAYLSDCHNDNNAFNAERKRVYDIEQVRLAEVKRQRDEQARIKRETEARESDKEHKGNVNREIMKVLMSNGISAEDAKTVITLAIRKQLPRLIIQY